MCTLAAIVILTLDTHKLSWFAKVVGLGFRHIDQVYATIPWMLNVVS